MNNLGTLKEIVEKVEQVRLEALGLMLLLIMSFLKEMLSLFFEIGYVHPYDIPLISKDALIWDVTISGEFRGFTSLHTSIGLVLMQGVW